MSQPRLTGFAMAFLLQPEPHELRVRDDSLLRSAPARGIASMGSCVEIGRTPRGPI